MKSPKKRTPAKQKIKIDTSVISSHQRAHIVSVTIGAVCKLKRSLSEWAQVLRSIYAHTCVVPRVGCVRVFLQPAMLTFFKGNKVLSTAPTKEMAEKYLSVWSVDACEVTNVFACGSVGKSLDLEAIRRKATNRGIEAIYDGTQRRHVLRCSYKKDQVHIDIFASGRFTVKSKSEKAACSAEELFIQDFVPQTL